MSFSRIHAAVLTAVTACLLAAPAAALAATSTTSSDYGEDTKLNLPSTNADGATGRDGRRRRQHRAHDRRPRDRPRRHLRPLLGPQAGQGLPRGRAPPARGLETVATLPLGPNRSLHLVRAGDELVLVGVAEHGVTPIRTYSEDEARALGPPRATPDDDDGVDRRREPAGRQAGRASARATRSTASARTVRQVKTDGSATPSRSCSCSAASRWSRPLLFTVTGFTRILIVLGFIRTGLGTPTAPPNQVLVGIALFLTLFVMTPTFNADQDDADRPAAAAGKITQDAGAQARARSRCASSCSTRRATKDLALFAKLAKLERPKTRADIPTYVLIPAFIISELKTAFQIGFLIFLPFLIIDLVVSSTLMSMGMMMLPPVFISLPFKILLFVLVDGWNLVTRSLVESFH